MEGYVNEMEQMKKEDEIQIDLGVIFKFVFRKWWIVLASLVIGCVCGFTFSSIIKRDTYSVQATYVVFYSGASDSLDLSGQSNVAKILGGCVTFAQQNRFFSEVAKDMNQHGYSIEGDDLEGLLSYSYSTDNGNFIFITATAEEPVYAYNVLMSVTNIFEDYIRENYRMTEDSSLVFSLANDIEIPTEPKSDKVKDTVIGGVGCMAVSILVLVLIVIFDQKVKNEDDLTSRYGIAVLGSIPNFEDKDLSKGGYYAEKRK